MGLCFTMLLPRLPMASKVTFVGTLRDAHSLAHELVVSPPLAPTHDMLSWGGRTPLVPKAIPPLTCCAHSQSTLKFPLHLLNSYPPQTPTPSGLGASSGLPP